MVLNSKTNTVLPSIKTHPCSKASGQLVGNYSPSHPQTRYAGECTQTQSDLPASARQHSQKTAMPRTFQIPGMAVSAEDSFPAVRSTAQSAVSVIIKQLSFPHSFEVVLDTLLNKTKQTRPLIPSRRFLYTRKEWEERKLN